MKHQNTLNKWLRYLLPVPTGIIVYILILLVFDTLDQLGGHFFSDEVIVTILFSFVLFEVQHFILTSIDKKIPILYLRHPLSDDTSTGKTPNASTRIIVIPLLSLLVSLVIISVLVALYFTYGLGLSDFNKELYVFNGVFGIVSVIYAIIHVSTTFMAVNKEMNYSREKELRKTLERDLESYKLQINPELLYDSLENIISIVRHDKKQAENLINLLSGIYRHLLDNRHAELTCLSEEIKNLNALIAVLNFKHNGSIKLINNIHTKDYERQIVPGSASTLVMELIKKTIINRYLPLRIEMLTNTHFLCIHSNFNPKITLEDHNHWPIAQLDKAHQFFGTQHPEIKEDEHGININIPLYEIEEE